MSDSASSSVFGKCRPVTSFQKLGRIGEGTYGTVYKAMDKDNNTIVALKRIIMHNEKHDGFPLTSIREIATLRRTNHPNCVKMLDVVVGHRRDGVFLVFEYCEHDLSALLDQVRSPFSESEVKSLVFQLTSAVAHLHDNWVIHRDIKLSNLLYNNRGEVKLADFGLARTFPSHCGISSGNISSAVPMTRKVVTLWYRAPELLLGAETYTTAIDVWAVGCVLGELLLGSPLLPGDSELDQVHRIFSLLGCPSTRIWPDMATLDAFDPPSRGRRGLPDPEKITPYTLSLAKEQQRNPFSNLQAMFPSPGKIGGNGLDCLNSMLTFDPKQRITARQCLRHLYFSTSPHPKEPDLMPTFPCQHEDIIPHSQAQERDNSARTAEAADFDSTKTVDGKECEGVTASSIASSASFASSLASSYTGHSRRGGSRHSSSGSRGSVSRVTGASKKRSRES